MRPLPRRLAHGEEATLVEHLGELRGRLVICLLALTVTFGVAFGFHHQILDWLNAPLPETVDGEKIKPATFGVAEPFMTAVIVSIWAGLAMAFPIILWQVWGFFAPALSKHTERTVLGYVAFASSLFIGGLFFAYFIVLNAAVSFLTNFDKEQFNILIRAKDYYSFVLWVLVAVAVVFELPIFILALARIGILPSSKLRRNRRIGYVIVAAVAVALPGVDPVTLMFTMIPLFVLFELSIWLSVFMDRRWAKQAEREAAELEHEYDADPGFSGVELDAL
jgi:sec-independent protein translocase protein TatC